MVERNAAQTRVRMLAFLAAFVSTPVARCDAGRRELRRTSSATSRRPCAWLSASLAATGRPCGCTLAARPVAAGALMRRCRQPPPS
jgi:hypothetical protein